MPLFEIEKLENEDNAKDDMEPPESEKPIATGTPSTGTARTPAIATGKGKGVGKAVKQCPILTAQSEFTELCEHPAVAKRGRYCSPHQRGYDCCFRDVWPRADIKKLDRAGKGRGSSSSSKKKQTAKATGRGKGRSRSKKNADSDEDSDEEPLTRAQEVWKEIFGDGRKDKGSQVEQSKFLEKFLIEFPDEDVTQRGTLRGGSGSGGHGEFVKRYVTSYGTRVSEQNIEDRPMWDKVLFQKRMWNERDWDPTVSEQYWQTLPSYEGYKSAMETIKGPDGKDMEVETRTIPAWMCGGKRDSSVVDNYQDHSILKKKKLDPEMSKAEEKELMADLKQGFDKVDAASTTAKGVFEEIRKGSAASSADDGEIAEQLMLSVHAEYQKEIDEPPKDAPTPVKEQPPKESGAPSPQMIDVGAERESISNAETDLITKAKSKFWKSLVKAGIEMRRFRSLKALGATISCKEEFLGDRLDLGLLYMGYEAQPDDINKITRTTEEFGTKIDFAAKVSSQPLPGITETVGYHSFVFRNKIKSIDCVSIEGEVYPISFVEKMPGRLGAAQTAAQLEQLVAVAEERRTQMQQLQKYIDNAIAVVAKANNKAEAARKLETAEAERKAQEERESQTRAAQVALQKIAVQKRSHAIFGLDWVGSGFKSIEVLDGDAALADHWTNANHVIKGPIIQKNSEVLTAILDDKSEDKVSFFMDKFAASFQSDEDTKNADRAAAKCHETKHGSKVMDPFWEILMPPKTLVDAARLEQLVPGLQQPYFFGLSATCVVADFEHMFFGCARVIREGAVYVMVISGAGLQEGLDLLGLPPDPKGNIANRIKTLLFAQDGKKDELPSRFQRAGITMWKGYIDCSSGAHALVVPPGNFVILMTANQRAVSGLSKSFLSKGEYSSSCFGATTKLKGASLSSMITLVEA